MNKLFKQQRWFMDHLSRLLILASISMALVFSCTGESPSIAGNSGSGTGVGNGTIMGKVIHSDSTPVKNADVRLRTDCYLADTCGKIPLMRNDTFAMVSTNSAGVFIIDSVRSGYAYCIEVLDRDSVWQNEGTFYKVDIAKEDSLDTVFLSTRVVAPVKEIKGTILTGLPKNAYIQIYGIERISKTDSLGRFELLDLPFGECERGECEYKVRVIIPLNNGEFKVYNNRELEIQTDSNGNIKDIELELDDEGDDDDD
jgi:hypothetical protein